MSAAKATINHDEIRQWVEERGGCPSHVRGSGRGRDPGILRIDFPGFTGQTSLEKIPWEAFFEAFEENELAFLYQGDKNSRFNKLVSRDTVEVSEDEQPAASRSRLRSAKSEPPSKKSEAPGRQIDAIALLEQQHRQVEALFHEYEQSEKVDDKLRVFEELADALAAHAKIEETIFYPAIYTDETKDELREAVEEHLAVKRVIADLLEMTPEDEQFAAKVEVLKELVDHHVEEEENKLFALAEKTDHEPFAKLGKQMKTLYDELMQEEPRLEVPDETQAAARLG